MAKRGKPPSDDEEIGYGKPPRRTRFKKGKSGNPTGRPKGISAERMKVLALKEAYRAVTVKEGDKIKKMPAIQAVMRGQIAAAAKGNGPSQRALLDMVRELEREVLKEEASKPKPEEQPQMSNLEIARRIAFVFAKAKYEQEKEKRELAAKMHSKSVGRS